MGEYKSLDEYVRHGVPQGSILGPYKQTLVYNTVYSGPVTLVKIM